jgi:hypothetical protein
MRCLIESRESAELLLAYASRKLDAETEATLERHCEACPACREFAEAQRAVWTALDAWEALPVSADFDRRLYRRIEEQVSWWDRLVRPFRPMLVQRGLPIAAAACLAVTAGILVDRPAGLPGDVPSVQAEAVQADQVETALDDMEMLREFHRTVRSDTGHTVM